MKKFILPSIIFITIMIASCKKDKQEAIDYDTQTSQDNSLADGIFSDANNISDQAMNSGSLSTYRSGTPQSAPLLSSCATVTLHPDSSGVGGNITVDFGTTNCRCLDGRIRNGVINIYYTGAYRDSGSQVVTTFSNYSVGLDAAYLYHVEGTKTVTNKGRNAAGNLYFEINIANARITKSNNQTMTWNSTRQREWIAGENTNLNWADDTYSITGSASGVGFEGIAFTVTITRPLIVELDCRWITSGAFDISPTGAMTRTVDYGNGTCNDSASVTINGRTFYFTLR